jgi:hypothetical protein
MTTTQEQYIIKLKQMVVKRFGSNISSADDCAALSDSVEEAVGVRIDMPTLQMLFARSNHVITPRHAVLTALAKYVGYAEGWSEFCFACTPEVESESNRIPVKRRWGAIIGVGCIVIAVAISVLLFMGGDDSNTTKVAEPTQYELIVNDVKESWSIITEVRCIVVRSYDATNREAFERNIATLLEEYKSEQTIKSIAEDIEEHAITKGITYSPNLVDSSAREIAQHCTLIINSLHEE